MTLPVDDTLVSGLRLSGAFTPNGDGINDALSIQFDVLKLLNPRPIRATIYDLQGRLVRTVRTGDGVAGRYQLSWDGRDKSGQRVRPGLYLFRLHVDGDASPYHLVRTVAVSY
ncbi:MAG: FlgD immunoglobulin-like domain containing protein [Candidatus Latescibacterota bacterium]